MKAVTAVCASTGASVAGGVSNGRVHRPRRDVENEEIQMYISKLKELVPFIPKNRKISKLEVIQCVIDYICDLQYALETHPGVATAVSNAINTTTAPAVAAAALRHAPSCSSTAAPRQPLGVLAPNTILPCASPDLPPATPGHVEKVTPSDSRPVSC